MKLKVVINLGDYENIQHETNEHEMAQKCAEEIINVIGRIPSYEVDNYLKEFILPIYYSDPVAVLKYKEKIDKMEWLDNIIKQKHELIKTRNENIFDLEEQYDALCYDLEETHHKYNIMINGIDELMKQSTKLGINLNKVIR